MGRGRKEDSHSNLKVIITEGGPYLVEGGIPLCHETITEDPEGYSNGYACLKKYDIVTSYALCRCGHSRKKPFCDGSHVKHMWNGKETAERTQYLKQCDVIKGPGMVLTDAENLCAFARFCHSKQGDVWGLTEESGDPQKCEAAIQLACNCPAGRLTAWDKDMKQAFEPELEPGISVLEDPDSRAGGPLYLKGGIPVISQDGTTYEVRNRVTLCRCGKSRNKPFCDASHMNE
jgi:CDGSH-type Zn-finger protein